MAAGMPQLRHDSLGVDAGCQDGDLGGVEHAVVVRRVFVLVTMPVVAALQGPAAGFGGQKLVFGVFKEDDFRQWPDR